MLGIMFCTENKILPDIAKYPARYLDILGSINELIWTNISFSKTFEKLERVLIGL